MEYEQWSPPLSHCGTQWTAHDTVHSNLSSIERLPMILTLEPSIYLIKQRVAWLQKWSCLDLTRLRVLSIECKSEQCNQEEYHNHCYIQKLLLRIYWIFLFLTHCSQRKIQYKQIKTKEADKDFEPCYSIMASFITHSYQAPTLPWVILNHSSRLALKIGTFSLLHCKTGKI